MTANVVRLGTWSVHRHPELPSTMDEAARLIRSGERDHVAVVTAHQTAGRGRSGRAWESIPGAALQLTALLRPGVPAERLGVVPLLVGVIVARAVDRHITPQSATLKWPNDVLIGEQKLAGILIVNTIQEREYILQIGIGINIGLPAGRRPAGATSVLDWCPRPTSVQALKGTILENVLGGLDELAASLRAGEVGPWLAEWRGRATMIGESVTVIDGGHELAGTFAGVAGDGSMMLAGEDGLVHAIHTGDVTRGPRIP